ncbi:MAG: hypothetical protein K2R93_05830 [Gemmatimonadaceae bacterium]|nr:hypothetical protein [Gemmatimonadaceae bacterium]
MALDPSARPISRRAAVSALSAVPAAVALSTLSIAASACQGADSPLVTVSEAGAALPPALDPALVRSIGQAWLAAHPAEATPEALTSALRGAQRARRQWPWQPLPPLTEVIHEEYTVGATSLPDGWVIADSEARCCARVALG